MGKELSGLVLTVLLLGAAVVGGLLTKGLWATEVEVEKVVTKEVEKTVEVPVETIKEVEVQPDYVLKAWNAVVAEVGDEDDFLTCDSLVYDEDEVSVSKLYDKFTYTQLDDKDNKHEVTFKVRLRFDDGKDDGLCRETRSYTVTFEDNEDSEVVLN